MLYEELYDKAQKSGLQVSVLERALSYEEMEALLDKYNGAKRRPGFRHYVPSPQDIEAYKQWIQGDVDFNNAARAMGVKSKNSVTNRFAYIGKMIATGELTI